MAIKLEPSPTFRAPVAIPVPGDGGFDIDFEFRHKTTEQRDKFVALHQFDLDAVREIIVGWKDDSVAYSDEALVVLLSNYPGAATAIITAYLRELAGARRGN
jgi:hypothetical protein